MELFSEETEVLPAEAYMQKIKADYSIPVERFVDPGIAASFVCKVCISVSLSFFVPPCFASVDSSGTWQIKKLRLKRILMPQKLTYLSVGRVSH